MAFHELDSALRPWVGPEAPADWMDAALRVGPDAWPRPHRGPCLLGGDAVRWCRQLGGGGIVCCELCARPVFVAPETCLERQDLEEISATFHASDLRPS